MILILTSISLIPLFDNYLYNFIVFSSARVETRHSIAVQRGVYILYIAEAECPTAVISDTACYVTHDPEK
jgi:hypothetical protein